MRMVMIRVPLRWEEWARQFPRKTVASLTRVTILVHPVGSGTSYVPNAVSGENLRVFTEHFVYIENEREPCNMRETPLKSDAKLWFLDHTSENMRSDRDCVTNLFVNIIQDESAKNAFLPLISNRQLPGLVSYLVYERDRSWAGPLRTSGCEQRILYRFAVYQGFHKEASTCT